MACELQFKWDNMSNKVGCICSSLQPVCLEIQRADPTGSNYVDVKKILRSNATDVISDIMIISMTELCNSDLHRNIRFRVVDQMDDARVFDEIVMSV